MRSNKGFIPLLPIILVTSILLLGAIFYQFSFISLSIDKLGHNVRKEVVKVPKSTDYAKISGKTELISEDLKLFIPTPGQDLSTFYPSHYYKAGIFDDGPYKGYTRVIALQETPNSMSGLASYTFVTRDFKHFSLDADPQKIESAKTNPEEISANDPRWGLDLTKVTDFAKLPKTVPDELSLNAKFGLHQERWNALMITPLSQKQQGIKLITDYSSYKKLDGVNTDFLFYVKNNEELSKEFKNYIDSETTGVIVVDRAGVGFKYSQTTSEKNKNFEAKMNEYEQKESEYLSKEQEIQQRIQKYKTETGKDDLVINDYPSFPNVPPTPNFSFDSIELKDFTKTDGSYFKLYEHAFPIRCSDDLNTYIINAGKITDPELEKFASIDGIELSVLKDKNHPLLKMGYQRKKKMNDELWLAMPLESRKSDRYFRRIPSYSEYVKQNPLFFFKDYWGRMAVLEENNFTITGGCGKPVIYLYPQKETNVSLQFLNPMKFDTTIPTYEGGWQVKAFPDGKIGDLQPKKTDCDQLIIKKGSEYAKDACINNRYPYLYWAGSTNSVSYPKIDYGWVVQSGEVEGLLKSKLTEIGLNTKEQSDMLEYWLPEIKKEGTPFYRISLLQNNDLNTLFPMEVNPKPDVVIRVFLDFLPMQSATELVVHEPRLETYKRHGFTLVEWGGLKR